MLDFTPKRPTNQPRFTLDPAERERAKSPVNRRRIWRLISLMGIMLVCGGMFYSFLNGLRNAIEPATEQLKRERTVAPMPRPTLEKLPPLPSAATLADQAETVQEMLKNGTAPLWIEQPDPGTLAWTRTILENDRANPPLPQRVFASDLMLGHVKVGSPILVSGMLEDSQPAPIEGADHGYQRLLIALDKDQYIEVLAPGEAAELVIGKSVQVVGRYLGPATLPRDANASTTPSVTPGAVASAGKESVTLPFIAARQVVHRDEASSGGDSNPYLMSGAWHLPDDIYQNVDDNLLVVETRPYYFTLGQVKLDLTTPGVFDNVPNANAIGSDIHKAPAEFRGKPFTVHGHVFTAWEDEGVQKDHPFGVDRVVRIIMWNEDYGPYEQQDSTGKVTVTNKLVLRAFELAAITHQPLPNPGDRITATGRFLRLRAMEVKENAARDSANHVTRQSNRAHTFLFVTNEYQTLPPPAQYDWTWLTIIGVGAATLLGGVLMIVASRESKNEELVFDSVRRLRQSRQALRDQRRAGAPAAAASPTVAEIQPPVAPSEAPPAAAPPTPPAP